ncbi:40S ribosomal protein S5-1 [Hordeum vulgare]|nr:40S ribosomal protein S5-1 [Hordeum vulgare]
MREGMLHIRDVEGPKKTVSVESRLEAMEQQVFKCQGMVERGLNANHMMITEFTNKHKIDSNDIGKHLSRLYDRIDHLQVQIYDLQNQNCDWRPPWSVGLTLRTGPLDNSTRRIASGLINTPTEASAVLIGGSTCPTGFAADLIDDPATNVGSPCVLSDE